MSEKTCTICGETFPATAEYFYRQRGGKNGLQAKCKPCFKQLAKKSGHKWRERNRERLRENAKRWRKDNIEHRREYEKEYSQNNKDKIRSYAEAYYQRNKEKISNQRKEYREKNPIAKKPTVYKIINLVNNKTYIGQTSNGIRRWTQHKSFLRHNKHDNPRLQKDWHTFGEEAFVFEIIEELACDTSSDVLLKKEAEQIKKHLNEGKELYNKLGG